MKKPPESVAPVVNIDEPEAGSKPKRFSVKGMKLPMKPPSDMFIIMATHTTAAKSSLCVVTLRRALWSAP